MKRCLDSLVSQAFKDFEVILSDDSPDDSVLQIAETYKNVLSIQYFKNNPALGTPANWNFAMQKAQGKYIKLMHDDDWFASPNALKKYFEALESNPETDFCFAAFYNVDLKKAVSRPVFCSSLLRSLLRKDRYNLFKRNFIGPPSVVFQRNNRTDWYDAHFKWLVDFEGYIRFLDNNKGFIYLQECLVNIGLSGEQVTSAVQHDPAVVLPESLYFLEKHGEGILNNFFVYDYYWRTLRNFGVKTTTAIAAAGWKGEVPESILKMIAAQGKVPNALLQFGPTSKLLMLLTKGTQRF